MCVIFIYTYDVSLGLDITPHLRLLLNVPEMRYNKWLVPDDTVKLIHICYYLICIFLSHIQIKRARFSLEFSAYVHFCTQIIVLYFLSLFRSQFLSLPQNVGQNAHQQFSKKIQVINNQLRSTIEERFNICQIKSCLSNNLWMIWKPFDLSTQ